MHVDGIENCPLQYVSTFILLSLCVPIIILGLEGACICVCDRHGGDEKLQIEIVLAYLDII